MISGGRKCKEIEVKKSERNQSENRAKTGWKQSKNRLCETSQSERISCEISTSLLNHLATQLAHLRKFSQLRNRFWHTSANSQHRSPHFAAAKWLRSYKAWKFLISQPKLHSVGYFAVAKPILAHECHFAAQWPPFRSCEMGCENSFFLRKPPFATKSAFFCENQNDL